ncbi:PDZ and LIM domain protein Zasp [Amphibalanus amphitrite]|uniref:PDZ and LIM domain protein Zasp n=1 Tax=Amphibalanus amphitrite TaxID=1232801 RepID=A0A6A4X3N7_AMPAM|nr:PDZ and LIM domain protein Zasp [Amphibalanus amphitrite]
MKFPCHLSVRDRYRPQQGPARPRAAGPCGPSPPPPQPPTPPPSHHEDEGGLASLRPPGAAQQQPVPKNVDTADGSVKALVHNQFNSPMPLYSEEKIAETLSAQTEVLAGGALGVDFKKNEKKYDGNMSEVLKMVQDMDQNPQSHAEPPEEAVDSAPLDPDNSGLNSIKSRSMRSLMVKPDGHGAPQTSVHAPRIIPQQQTKVPPPVAPKPAAPMSPQPAPMAPQAAPANRGPPGMRSEFGVGVGSGVAVGWSHVVAPSQKSMPESESYKLSRLRLRNVY